jgi:formylmethanofuran dehydrogenase subunit E
VSKLDDFLAKKEEPGAGDSVEWFAAVLCQLCGENVYEQRLYPADGVLVWQCSKGHKSFMENYTSF